MVRRRAGLKTRLPQSWLFADSPSIMSWLCGRIRRSRRGRRCRLDRFVLSRLVLDRLVAFRFFLVVFVAEKLAKLLLAIGVVARELADVERQERCLVAPLHHRELTIPSLDGLPLKH